MTQDRSWKTTAEIMQENVDATDKRNAEARKKALEQETKDKPKTMHPMARYMFGRS